MYGSIYQLKVLSMQNSVNKSSATSFLSSCSIKVNPHSPQSYLIPPLLRINSSKSYLFTIGFIFVTLIKRAFSISSPRKWQSSYKSEHFIEGNFYHKVLCTLWKPKFNCIFVYNITFDRYFIIRGVAPTHYKFNFIIAGHLALQIALTPLFPNKFLEMSNRTKY